MQPVIDKIGSRLSKKRKKSELKSRDGMWKVYKSQLFDYSISAIVMRLDLRRLLIPLLRMLQIQTRY